MRTIKDIRRQNLRYVINARFGGVTNRMAKQTGIAQMQLARVFLNSSNRREMGERLARRIEKACQLEEGWIDQDHAKVDAIGVKLELLDVQSRMAVEAIIDALLGEDRTRAVAG